MDVSHRRYYKMNEILMSLIGQWPYQSRRARRLFLAILIFLFATQVGPQIMAVIKYRHDPEIVLECITPFFFDALCLVKLITCMANSKKILRLLNRIDGDWKEWANDREVSILHEYAEAGRKITIAYTVVIYTTGIIFMTQPILPKIIDVLIYNGTEPGAFPVPVYYPLDQQKYYFSIIVYTYACISMIIIITIAGDTMYIVYVQHACGIFAALGHKLRRIGTIEKSALKTNMELEYLATCVNRHNDAIEFAKIIEGIYSGCLFFVVGFNMLMISITSLQLVVGSNGPEETLRFVSFIGAQLIHLYIEAYFAQALMDHSTSVRDYIHSAKWYNVSIKSQKLLNFMAMRCNKPCKLTAGKICIMSVETFGVVVKTSMSYFTLLRSMQ